MAEASLLDHPLGHLSLNLKYTLEIATFTFEFHDVGRICAFAWTCLCTTKCCSWHSLAHYYIVSRISGGNIKSHEAVKGGIKVSINCVDYFLVRNNIPLLWCTMVTMLLGLWVVITMPLSRSSASQTPLYNSIKTMFFIEHQKCISS